MLKKSRKGFSLVELLIAVAVLGILGAITFVAGSSAQRRARVTSAMTAFDDYRSAFDTAIMDHPGVVTDRSDLWEKGTAEGGAPGAQYTSKDAFANIVQLMNKSLDDKLTLEWDDGLKAYASRGEDPWGGKYVLLEYPEKVGDNIFDLTKTPPDTGAYRATMCFSIWCTGPDAGIVDPSDPAVSVNTSVSDGSVGCTYMDKAGDLISEMHGAQDGELPFTGSVIHFDNKH